MRLGGENKLRHRQFNKEAVKCSSRVFIQSSVSRSAERKDDLFWQFCIISHVTVHLRVFFSRCAGQHGEVQRPGSLQLQHADSVRPREVSVRRRAGGVVRPGPQRHQQTATATGNTHVNTRECTHGLTHFSKADLRGLKLNSIIGEEGFQEK